MYIILPVNNHHHHHRFVYSEEERRKRQNPEHILESIGLKSGMRFIDVGCNDGFFTLPAARIVGSEGKVFAIDIDKTALAKLSEKLLSEQLVNTTVICRPAEDVIIDNEIADIIFYGTVLHDFKDPLKVLKNASRMLKPDGIIVDYDWRRQNSPIGPPYEIRFSQEYVEQLANEAGLTIISSEVVDSNFYSMTFKKH